MQFKRPALRIRRGGVYRPPQRISPLAKGLAAEIAHVMNNQVLPGIPRSVWTPPNDYKYIAKYLPEDEAAMLIARCESWFEANPRPVVVPVEKPQIDTDIILALYAKYPGRRPPLEETIDAWRSAGMSEERMNKYRAWWQKMEATSDERQKELDRIFAKYPSANKPVPKIKKVIKAVNKKKA